MPLRIHRKLVIWLGGLLSAAVVSAATIVVNDETSAYHDPGCGTSGTGQCTLLDAIAFANANPGPDAIHFNLPGVGTRTIVPSVALPALTDDAGVTIDGFTQPGSSSNTLPAGSNAVWRVRLSGGPVTAQGAGILVQSDNNVVRGLILQAWQSGVEIAGGSGNQVAGNLIGLDIPGELQNGSGVLLRSGANGNRVGGTSPADRNVISRNGEGIQLTDLGTENNVVEGNIIGLSPSGATVLRNYRGILLFQGASSNRIGGTLPGAGNVISGNETNGINLFSSVLNNRIEGNLIGTTPDGSAALGNLQAGISIFAGPQSNVVGGSTPGAGNLISGNGGGVSLEGFGTAGNRIEGNSIGTDLAGNRAIPNGWGVATSLGAENNVIGGAFGGARNIISGNEMQGVILGVLSRQNLVLGNYIGTDRTGTSPLPNGSRPSSGGGGILVHASQGNRIGGQSPGEENVVAYNGNVITGGFGIAIHPGDDDSGDDGNAVLSNSIHDNIGLGIDLTGPGAALGVTPNDPGDVDFGANQSQNFPVIESVGSDGATTTVRGTLNSAKNSSFTIQFFSSPRCDDSNFGEGETILGSAQVRTNGTGNASFEVTLPVGLPQGRRVTATATDADGSTSEFSQCSPLQMSFYTVTPCRVADTRTSSAGPLLANSNRTLPITGMCGIPGSAQAVSLNVTVTEPSATGHLTIYPAYSRIPNSSAINFRPGQTRANNVIAQLGAGGTVSIQCLQQPGGSVQVILDVNGYFE